MNASPQIRYVPYADIDKHRWDACIDQAANGLIYARSVYLDGMAGTWDALVMGDYQAVMPLTWKQKYGICYLYQPFLCACLGVFGREVSAALTEAFLLAIPAKFRYWDIYLNHGNAVSSERFTLYRRVNHVLRLHPPYDMLFLNFRPSYRQLLKKSAQGNTTVSKDIAIEQVIALAKETLQPLFAITAGDYNRFRALYMLLRSRGQATSYGVYSGQQALLASGVFLLDGKRAYYILAGNHPDGREAGASHQVINAFIRDHAQRQLVLDFEGSDVGSIAFFFRGFGAIEEVYPGIRYNRLPRVIRWLKQ